MTAGDAVFWTGEPLYTNLQPGMLYSYSDALQQPYQFDEQSKQYNAVAAQPKYWKYEPRCKIGDTIAGGDVFGIVPETIMVVHKLMVPTNLSGTVTFVAVSSEYAVNDMLVEIESKDGKRHALSMVQKWPLRQPRPIVKQLPLAEPLFTGVRVIDAGFPIAQGGQCMFKYEPKCGTSTLANCIVKNSNSEVVVFVECDAVETYTAADMVEISTTYQGSDICVMNHTSIVVHKPKMPITLVEISYLRAASIAEYYRDMGLNVTLIGDEMNEWGTALNAICNLLPEFAAPIIAQNRQAAWFNRASKVHCIGTDNRTGSLTIFGGYNSATSTVACNLTLDMHLVYDVKLAQKKCYPAIDCTLSHSNYVDTVAAHYATIEPDFQRLRTIVFHILQQEASKPTTLTRNELDLVIAVAKLIREDFLQQNVFMLEEICCSPYKMLGMLHNFVLLYELAAKVVDHKTYDVMCNEGLKLLFDKLAVQKFKSSDNADSYLKSVKYDILAQLQ